MQIIIGSSKSEVGFLSLHKFYTILDTKRMIAKEVTYTVWLNLKIANHLGEQKS